MLPDIDFVRMVTDNLVRKTRSENGAPSFSNRQRLIQSTMIEFNFSGFTFPQKEAHSLSHSKINVEVPWFVTIQTEKT